MPVNDAQREAVENAKTDPVGAFKALWGDDLIDELPSNLAEGYARFWFFGIMPGGFLSGIIRNSLFETVANADRLNRPIIADITEWFANYGDRRCIGSVNAAQWEQIGGYVGTLSDSA